MNLPSCEMVSVFFAYVSKFFRVRGIPPHKMSSLTVTYYTDKSRDFHVGVEGLEPPTSTL